MSFVFTYFTCIPFIFYLYVICVSIHIHLYFIYIYIYWYSHLYFICIPICISFVFYLYLFTFILILFSFICIFGPAIYFSYFSYFSYCSGSGALRTSTPMYIYFLFPGRPFVFLFSYFLFSAMRGKLQNHDIFLLARGMGGA